MALRVQNKSGYKIKMFFGKPIRKIKIGFAKMFRI